MMLTLEQLCVDIAGVKVLRNISAHLQAGTTVAVVGRNGAGKTSLLRSIMGLLKAEIDTEEVHALTMKTYTPAQYQKFGGK